MRQPRAAQKEEAQIMIMFGNGVVVTRDAQCPLINGGAVAVGDDGLISALGPTQKLRREYPGAHFVDARGGLIMPGLINLHHHAYYTLARGLTPRPGAGKGLPALLEGRWWRLDRAMNLEDVYHGAAAAFLECVRSGVTTVFDHHASYGAVTGSLSEISRAADELGLRACLCYEVSDRDGEQKCLDSIEENAEFIKWAKAEDSEMIKAMFGGHALFTISDKTFERMVKANDGMTGFHIHVSEGMNDVYDSLQNYGRRPVQRLQDHGILGPMTVLGHCVHLNTAEMDIVKATDTMVVNNPQSNMSNAVGCAPVLQMYAKGILVGLGTDAYTHDMIESCKTVVGIQRHNACHPNVGWCEATDMLFKNNPKIAGKYFGREFGVLKLSLIHISEPTRH